MVHTEASESKTQVPGRKAAKALSNRDVFQFAAEIFGKDLHAKRVLALANATHGTIHAAGLGIHAIGRGLSAVTEITEKAAVNQINRYVGNDAINPWVLFSSWVPYIIGGRRDLDISIDWTDFDRDKQTTITAALHTNHGRSMPLVWFTVSKDDLTDRRNEYEDRILVRLKEVLPADAKVTIVADRGFADQKLFRFLEELGWRYIIRIRNNIWVTNEKGERRKAKAWMGKNGRMRVLRNALLTEDECPVGTMLAVKRKGMKDAWYLVCSDPTMRGTDIIKKYGKRFCIEELFRDMKDPRFGFGLEPVRTANPARRDRLLFAGVLATSLLTMLGAAGEAAGLDRVLKTNTSKRRQLSLLRQGIRWYAHMPNMRADWADKLLPKFAEMMREHAFHISFFGLKTDVESA